MKQIQERRESPVLYEYCAAMADLYKAALCTGEARLSGAAFRAACRCCHAVAELQVAEDEQARQERVNCIRGIVVESLYWVWLLELRDGPPDEKRCTRAVYAAENLLERIESL